MQGGDSKNFLTNYPAQSHLTLTILMYIKLMLVNCFKTKIINEIYLFHFIYGIFSSLDVFSVVFWQIAQMNFPNDVTALQLRYGRVLYEK